MPFKTACGTGYVRSCQTWPIDHGQIHGFAGVPSIRLNVDINETDRAHQDCHYREAQTPSDNFIISQHPRHQGLSITTGGSGHAFKFIPTLGMYVSQLLDGALSEKLQAKWQWAPSTTVLSGRPGAKHMFTAPVQELSDFPGWQPLPAKL
jgi:hypothetical protein